MKSTLLSLLGIAAFVYVCFCAYLYLFQRSFIYFPTPAISGAPAEELWIESDGERLRIWRLNAGARGAIIYFGGNAEDVAQNISEFSQWFPSQAIYLVNYRGYGGSSGSPGEPALLRDAEAVFKLVQQNHADLSLIGRSLGAAVAIHLAAKHDVKKMALVTPFDSLASLARNFYPIFPTSLLLKDKFDSLAQAGRVKAAVLILIAEHDEIIPRESSANLAEAFDTSLLIRVIDDTAHNTVDASPEYGRVLRQFMTDRHDRIVGQ